MQSKSKNYIILIVEDEEVNYLYLETLFDFRINIPCQLLHAKNGKEAVEICESRPDIDLVFMDLKLPLLNGYDATIQIRGFRPELSIIAQTAYSAHEDHQRAISVGCTDFISKPIKEVTIKKILNKYLDLDSDLLKS